MVKPDKKKAKNILATNTNTNSRVRKLKRKDKKKAVKATKQIPGSFSITSRALKHLWKHKKLFAGALLVYTLLYVVFVRGLAMNFQLSTARESLEDALGGSPSVVDTANGMFGALLSTAGQTSSEAAGVYQLILFVLISLATIWLLRATYENKNAVKLKQAFYQSSYPVVQYLLVGSVILLQALPMLIGLSLYTLTVNGGIELSALEQIFWTSLMIIGVAVSSYFLSASLFASYIVTLPGTDPRTALRSAKKLVKYRRFAIIRKVLFLPLLALLFLVLVFVPLVLVLPVVAEILFMVVSLAGLFVAHAYFYTLYRELL